MLFNPLNAPFYQVIESSLQKALLILFPHLATLALVLGVSVFPLAIKLLLVIVITLSTLYYSRLHLLQTLKKSVKTIQYDSANNWFVKTYDENHESSLKSVVLLPSSFISKALIVLNYRDNTGSNYSALITADSISSNEFRRLRVRLKLTDIKNK